MLGILSLVVATAGEAAGGHGLLQLCRGVLHRVCPTLLHRVDNVGHPSHRRHLQSLVVDDELLLVHGYESRHFLRVPVTRVAFGFVIVTTLIETGRLVALGFGGGQLHSTDG